MTRSKAARLIFAGLVLAAVLAVPAGAFNAVTEEQNYSKIQERQNIYLTPQYQLLLTQVSEQDTQAALEAQANDPARNFVGRDVCWNGGSGCAGDARLYDWGPKNYGLVEPVLFTARNGATISGHVWATRAGPAKRPGIVITDGSVQADEQMYWYAAQALAKDGYVVLTFDPQGQGQSDFQGEAPDQNEGVPAQTDGRPFFDGTEDAINFFVSTPAHPYEPVPSCNSGTSHAAKQNQRVKEGLDTAYDPFWKLLEPNNLGLAGHSYGAAAVSYIGQWDPRVKAIVAWDNLAPPNPNVGILGNPMPAEQGCVNKKDRQPAPITKPALGMSADYFLPPEPNTSQPNPTAKSTESFAYTKAGVDTGEIIIRGGSHLDFSFIPFPPVWMANPPFGATLRGADMIAWYTSAWFDKYLKHDCTADRRLLTDRWRHDGEEASVDPNHDGNMFSFYYPSRLDIHLANGRRYDNENLRDDTNGLYYDDGYQGEYSYIDVDRSPDLAETNWGACPASSRRPHSRRAHRRHRRRHRSSKQPAFTG